VIVKPPLYGPKTHPLTKHAKDKLWEINHSPIPASDVNPGVLNRFMREDLVKFVRGPSPFKSHKGKMIDFLEITGAGRAALAE